MPADAPFLTVLMGIPGSGKTLLASPLSQQVISSDSIRKEITGGAADQSQNRDIPGLIRERVASLLARGEDVAVDATNVKDGDRQALLVIAKSHSAKARLVILRASLHECVQRNQTRDRVVPLHVMMEMYTHFRESLSRIGFEEWDVIENVWGNWFDATRIQPHHHFTSGGHGEDLSCGAV